MHNVADAMWHCNALKQEYKAADCCQPSS